MKKIILCLSIVVLLSGCGTEEMATCTRENTYNGLKSGTTYDITYKNDEVKHVKITYEYNQDVADGIKTGTDGTTNDDASLDANDGVVGGVVGDTINDVIGGVYDTILDLSGIKTRHTNQINNTTITGFTSKVEDNTNNSYKVTYDLDLTKISDTDITRFNVDRSYKTLINNYTSQGLTCK